MYLLKNISRVSPSGEGLGGNPTPLPEKLACPSPPHCFDLKMLILSFSYSFWPFCPNCPPHQSTHLGNPDKGYQTCKCVGNVDFLLVQIFFQTKISTKNRNMENIDTNLKIEFRGIIKTLSNIYV